MAEHPAMPLWVGDYMRDTRHLSCVEHGAYLQLLLTMWVQGGRIPLDHERLARIVGLRRDHWERLAPTILAFFQVHEEEVNPNVMVCTLGHKRVDSELDRVSKIRAHNRAAGKRGGDAKSLKSHNPPVAPAKPAPSDRYSDGGSETVATAVARGVAKPWHSTQEEEGKQSKSQKTHTSDSTACEPAEPTGVRQQGDNRGSKAFELDPAWVALQRELVALYDERGIIGMPNTETCREWKELGLDRELCYAVVAAKLTGADFKPLSYFTKAIQRAQAEKANVVPIKPPVAINWDFVFRTYVENRNCRRWEASYFCPPPPSPQCIAPLEMFIKYDIDPKTGYFNGYSRTTDKLIEPKGLPANSPGPAKVTG